MNTYGHSCACGSLSAKFREQGVRAGLRLDACIAAIAWWMLGWGFAYGDVPQYGWIGREQCASSFIFGQLEDYSLIFSASSYGSLSHRPRKAQRVAAQACVGLGRVCTAGKAWYEK